MYVLTERLLSFNRQRFTLHKNEKRNLEFYRKIPSSTNLLTDNRASCSTTIFTAAMLALVTEVLGLPGRVSSSTENFPA